MKIIDLLNKIANGEEAPEKIRFLPYDTNNEYAGIYIKKGSNYLKENWSNVWLFEKGILNMLNDEVEIIEEEKKIPEKIPIGLKQTKDGIFNTIVKDDIQYELNEKEEMICKKIHEIIDYLQSKGDE